MKKFIYSTTTLLTLLIVSFMGLSAQPLPPTLGEDDLPVGGVPNAAATVTTQAVTEITNTTATGNGNITDLGVPNPTAHGICWNTTGTPTIADDVVDNGPASTTGAFTAAISSLSAGTMYYVRAYATNSTGTSYGSQVSFTPPPAPVIADVYPADGDTLHVDSIYTILATVTTEDAEGIDSVKFIFGLSPTMMFEDSTLYNEVDTFSNFFSIGEVGTYYGQIIAYGGNGEMTLGDTIEITAISLAPQIIKSYPSQDTIFTVGDSLKIGIIATVTQGSIDTALILLSIDGINPMMAQELFLIGDDFYGIYGMATEPQAIYIAFAVIANGDTAMTDFFLFDTQCGEIDTVTALAADGITDAEFTAIWTSSEEASHYSLDIWTIADGDTSYTVKDQSIPDTTYTATNLDVNTMYYYNVKVVTEVGCESSYSNTVSVRTALATGLNETISRPSVSTQTKQIKVSTISKANIRVYHISGTLIASELLMSDKTFDVNSGVYLVKVDNQIHKVIVP